MQTSPITRVYDYGVWLITDSFVVFPNTLRYDICCFSQEPNFFIKKVDNPPPPSFSFFKSITVAISSTRYFRLKTCW